LSRNHKQLSEVEEYFIEQYKNSSIRVTPGHWPKFKTKEEVDEWLGALNKVGEYLFKKGEEKCD